MQADSKIRRRKKNYFTIDQDELNKFIHTPRCEY